MKIAHVRIRNILGIEELEFTAGRFNVISGHNGANKTSVIEAIKSIVPGTEDATLLRRGADRGEVVLLCDDGTEFKRKVGVGRGLSVTKDGARSPEAAREIRGLLDALSVNPVEFLSAKPKDRINVLLESLPMQVDPARLEHIAGSAAQAADPLASALDQIAAVRKAIFDERTLTNRARTEKEATINQLAATLPRAAPGAPTGDLMELEASLAEVDAADATERTRVADKLEGIRKATSDQVEALREEIAKLQVNLAETERKAGLQRDMKRQEFAAKRAPLVAQITTIKANVEAAAAAEATRKTLVQMRQQADGLAGAAERCTTEIDALDAYKSELLAALPIPGLEVREGEVFRDGIPFDRLNKGQQVEIAVEIAKLRAGDLGIICVDELERLDTEHFEAFRTKALESGLQLFVTRVADGPFAVTAADSPD